MNHNITAVHLDAVGGIAGDMFAAAILDANPDLWPECQHAVGCVEFGKEIMLGINASGDERYKGSRFSVNSRESISSSIEKHVSWLDIRRKLEVSKLKDAVKKIAIDIFSILADAEAAVHDISPEHVVFHEVGATDSIIDIVVAAVLIEALSPCQWSVSALPRGGGQINSQHGYLPLPAPATLNLLEGFLLVDDGEKGERVTPTGAAILKHLNPTQNTDKKVRLLLNCGMGFGDNRLQQRANVLRATFYADPPQTKIFENIDVLRCEIDDQTAEELAIAIEHIRLSEGVLDICQWPVYAKKGRIAAALQILTEPSYTEDIITTILNETETLGVRQSSQNRRVLQRQETKVGDIRVKIAERPNRISAKADIDDVAVKSSAAARRASRHKAETHTKKSRAENDE